MYYGEISCQLKPPFHTSASLMRFSLAKDDNLNKRVMTASDWNSEFKKEKKKAIKCIVIPKEKKF